MEDGFRVEVDLDDEEHGYSFRERLRALDLDDKARERLGKGVMVTRDGARLFLYASSEKRAREAGGIVRALVDDERLTADLRVTRWHPVEEAWKDASIPLPATPDEEAAEYAAREDAEAAEAELEGGYDWSVVVHVPGRDAAGELADRLTAEGVDAPKAIAAREYRSGRIPWSPPNREFEPFMFSFARDFALGDAEMSKLLYEGSKATFLEDAEMLEAVQANRRGGSLDGLVDIAADAAQLQARRMLDQLINADAA